MVNDKSLKAIDESRFSKAFIRPLYESYGFSNVIGTIESILTGKSDKKLPEDVLGNLGNEFDTVVLFFIDGLGWRFIEPRLKDNLVVKKLTSNGVLSKLTSVFPSTTAAAVPTMNSGMEPVETELIEFRQYNEKADDIIMPIKFKHGYKSRVDLTKEFQLSPSELYPAKNVYKEFANEGITSFTFLGDSYANSEFNKVLMEGSNMFSYITLNEGLYELSKLIDQPAQGKRFFYFYINSIDDIAHKYGAGSPELDLEIDNTLRLIDELLLNKVREKQSKTLLLITADHGHDVFDPEETIYINKIIPEFEDYLKRNANNEPILPGGSAKDLFLYIKPDYVDKAKEKLEQSLNGVAEVYKSKDLLDQGFFGSATPSNRFKKIVGDLIILPYNGQSVWWYRGDKYLKQAKGQHGGLSRNEMEIPLFAYPL